MMILLLLLSQTPVKVTNNKADATATAGRCVNAAGTAFESCAGWSGPDGGSLGNVAQGVGIDGGRVWAVEGQVAVTNFPATQPVSGTVTATIAFDAGFVSVANFPASQAVTGPLTDAQLRASTVPVSLASTTVTGTVTTTALTDAQLRASAVTIKDQGIDTGGVARTVLTDPTGAVYVIVPSVQLNPFLPRCNPVRRTGCLP